MTASVRLVVLQPPGFGQPCNGCGRCCREEVCQLGVGAFGQIPGPCPALLERDGRTWCAIVEEADRVNVAFAAHLKWRLGVGLGCDAEFDDVATPTLEGVQGAAMTVDRAIRHADRLRRKLKETK